MNQLNRFYKNNYPYIYIYIYMDMDNLLKILKNYDLIGIGEQAHGELISWKIRYKIIKYLTKYYDKVYIFCEQLDYFVNGLNNKNVKFIFNEDGFYPHIMARSNLTNEHLYYTKKINKLLPKIKFYGIDIQVVKYNDLYNKKDMSSELYNIIEKYKDEYLKKNLGSGIIRNKCNAFIINDLIQFLNKKNVNSTSNNKFIYLGHNEHIAFNCFGTNKDKKYLTDGYYLKNICNIKYLSIATYSNELYNVWHCIEINKCKIKLLKGKNKKIWNDLFNKNKNYKIISNSDSSELKMDDYSITDFDYVICVKKNHKITLLKNYI